jgi:hypothetical protein
MRWRWSYGSIERGSFEGIRRRWFVVRWLDHHYSFIILFVVVVPATAAAAAAAAVASSSLLLLFLGTTTPAKGKHGEWNVEQHGKKRPVLQDVHLE